ncbi:Methyltransferase type 12 [Desulfarculus baarsii DSM 2075]|uniref:Methyltransferase type 12 n=1 Tax=Desulfarculus baarsii (strain ATCC 33931 / DSM 2075 / LMG 7858 / VKM B-1802 / 2st14) TaxID=644282 RepID=E1QGI9_DESB2|nr:class I SAM-dependent methyltransferase [Desulfarculus baarsii]ADK84682.1 Methyltransferase type 12 [Desulfarculus baarsii DSM 2075]
MKTPPQATNSWKGLHDLLNGAVGAKLLRAGLELRVFDALGDYRSAAEAATAIGAHPENTRLFLDGLTCLGLLEKRQGRYRNLPATQEYLTSASELFLGPLFGMIQTMSIDALDDLATQVRQGPSPAGQADDFAAPELWAQGARDGAGWVLGQVGQQMAELVAGLEGFANFQRMLDLGGGHGLFAIYFASRHPAMKAVVFDRAPVLVAAKEFIAAYGMGHRVSVAAGDYLSDDIGGPYDLVWASATLNFARHDLDALMAKIRAALKPGGYFVSFQDGLTDERTGPAMLLGALGNALRSGFDMYFDQGEIARAMLRGGFGWVHSRTIHTPMGQMELDIARS